MSRSLIPASHITEDIKQDIAEITKTVGRLGPYDPNFSLSPSRLVIDIAKRLPFSARHPRKYFPGTGGHNCVLEACIRVHESHHMNIKNPSRISMNKLLIKRATAYSSVMYLWRVELQAYNFVKIEPAAYSTTFTELSRICSSLVTFSKRLSANVDGNVPVCGRWATG